LQKNLSGVGYIPSGETNNIPFCGKDDRASARQNRVGSGEIEEPAEIWLTGISS
jgi:hypothetical protein